MKHLLLAACLLATAAPALAQKTEATSSSQPLPRANVIVVRTPDSLAVAYPKLVRALLAAGYGLERNEKELGFLATQYRPTSKRHTVQVALRIAFLRESEGTVIEVRGNAQIAGLLSTLPIENRGQSGSSTLIAWQEMQKAAELYPNGFIAYRKQP